MAVIKTMIQQLKINKIVMLLLLAFASSTIIVISTTQISVLLNQLYQELADYEKPFFETVLLFAIAYTLRSIFKLIRNHITAYIGNDLVNVIREFSVASLIRKHGNVSEATKQYTVLTYDLNAIAELLSWRTFVFLEDLMILCFAIWKIWGYHTLIAIFIVLVLLIIGCLSFYLGRSLESQIKRLKQTITRMSGFMRENLLNQKAVRAFQVEDIQYQEFHKLCKSNEQVQMEIQQTNQQWIPLMDSLGQAALFLSLGIGVIFLIKGQGTIGFLALLNGYLFLLTNVAADLGNLIYFFMNSKESIKRIRSILQIVPKTEEKRNIELNCSLKVRAEWEDIRFNNQLLFAAGKATFRRDEITVIKGETGVGKTVFADRIAGLGTGENFSLYWNDQKITDDLKEIYWEKIGYDLQQYNFFHENILENIYLWKEKDRKNLNQLIKHSCLEFVYELENGFNTLINSDSNFLSGGEKQRICLARALAKEPEILIIDDALQAIDSNNKKRILEYLQEYKQGRIIIIISADADVAEYADIIYEIKGKRIHMR